MSHPVDILNAAIPRVSPGAQLAASIGGRRLALESVGQVSVGGPPVEDHTVFDLASLTKPLSTGMLLGRALQDGRCRLRDDIQKYLYACVQPHRLVDLAEHAAGLPAHLRMDQRLPSEVAAGTWAAHDWIVGEVGRLEAKAPGTRAVYSDLGYILLGAALEQLWGRPLSDLQDELFPALFFRDQRAGGSQADDRVYAETEGGLRGIVHDENCRAMGGVAGHAGLFGSAQSVLQLCERLLDAYHGGAEPILSQDTVRRLWQPSRLAGSTRTLCWDRPSPGVINSTGGTWPTHSVGHLGFTGTSVWIEPERGLVVVLLTNRVCPSRDNPQGIRALREQVYSAAWQRWAGA